MWAILRFACKNNVHHRQNLSAHWWNACESNKGFAWLSAEYCVFTSTAFWSIVGAKNADQGYHEGDEGQMAMNSFHPPPPPRILRCMLFSDNFRIFFCQSQDFSGNASNFTNPACPEKMSFRIPVDLFLNRRTIFWCVQTHFWPASRILAEFFQIDRFL